MSKSGSYRPVVLIRRLLLVALALFLGAVVAIFIDNRMSDEAEIETGTGSELDSSLADIILSGKGFDYEVTDGEQRLFHIRADRILADRDNVVTLEGIVLTVERDSGEVYELAAKSGRYQSKRNTAEVEGNVVLTGPDGVEMKGQKFALLNKGKLVRSRAPIEFAAGDRMTGSANEIEAYLKKDRFQLTGKVRLSSEGEGPDDAMSLRAKRVVYDKPDNLVHAEGEVTLLSGRDQLTCGRIAVTLAGKEESQARFVRARWNVAGTLVSDDPRGFERRLRFAGEEVSIAYGKDGSEPRRAEIAGTANAPVRFDQADDSGMVRRFSTRRLEATFRKGQVREVTTAGAMTMTEFLEFDETRELSRVCGGVTAAKFDREGELAEFQVIGGVDLHRPGFQTTGETLTARGKDLVEVEGEPAYVYTGEGELSAPQLAYHRTTGDVAARSGVRAWFPPDGDFTMVTATETSADLPIQVTAETAKWAQATGEFEFQGKVRAWQGESFLTAERLIGENGGRLRALGGVQTTLERQSTGGGEGEDEQRGPVRVSADTLDYTKAENLIEYKGNSEVRDSGRLMSCDDLAVYLGEGSSLDRLECSGETLIDDRVGGRKVRGSEALYRPGDSKVEVSGSPVTLENPDGAVIRAGRVLYDFETSTAQFQSATSSNATAEGGDR
ncbi:MAG: LPS export ABC transporter periplasmic protein LptC [bacterium]|nr:LPS export ABC transporter periplasmic protein LptC [bacterium]